MKKAREMRASERIAIARLGNVRNIEKMKAPGDKNTQPRPFNLKIDEVNLLNLLTYFSVSGLIWKIKRTKKLRRKQKKEEKLSC